MVRAVEQQTTTLTQGFSEGEIAKLEEILEGFGTDIEWAVGFLAAVVSGPDPVPPSKWLPVVQGDEPFASTEDGRVGLDLLMRLYNHVRTGLDGDVEALCPDPEDADEIASFCGGYLEGSRMHPSWEGDRIATVPVIAFAGLAAGDELDERSFREADGKPGDLEAWKKKQRAQLARNVEQIHVHFEEKRAAARPKGVPVVKAAKIGRNDPCKCGSGKKSKKCCGK
jgi:uncharacterized protein